MYASLKKPWIERLDVTIHWSFLEFVDERSDDARFIKRYFEKFVRQPIRAIRQQPLGFSCAQRVLSACERFVRDYKNDLAVKAFGREEQARDVGRQ